MKWINHMVIAGSTTAIISPPHVPIAILGSTAPDWMEWLSEATGNKVKHRTVTHYLTVWIGSLLFFLLLWDFHGIGAAFVYGGLTHIIADSLTVAGVPFSPLSDRRFHLFGGRLRTGEPGEYMIAFGIGGACFLISTTFTNPEGWYPFFYNWAGLYQDGVVDAHEWKVNRFRFF